MLDAIQVAVSTLLQPTNILLIVGATLLGLLFGIIPGLSGTVGIALMIPLTFTMEPLQAFMVLAALKGGTNFGGSVTAILINTPGQGPNAATILDGFPMTRNGEAGRALGASATASALGAFFGVFVLILFIPIMVPFLLSFGPPELFWLGLWGLTVIAVVVRGNTLVGLISALLGIAIAIHGQSPITMTDRWIYGTIYMLDGFKLVPALIGIFAVAEMINILAKDRTIAKTTAVVTGGQWQGMRDVFHHKVVFFRSAVIGTIIGMIPGVGGTAANFIAYFNVAQSSGEEEKFGKGDVRGVIASEASNDAKDGGMLLPTLAFGIPGSASMAVLLGAFLFHGINPGPVLFSKHPDVIVMIILALLVSNVITSSVGLAAADLFAKITQLDVRMIAPVILGIAFYSSFTLDNSFFNVLITLIFGILGLIMIQENMSRVPLILAMVLAPIIEDNMYISLQISRGDPMVFFQSGVAVLLVALTLFSLTLPIWKVLYKRRRGNTL